MWNRTPARSVTVSGPRGKDLTRHPGLKQPQGGAEPEGPCEQRPAGPLGTSSCPAGVARSWPAFSFSGSDALWGPAPQGASTA